jgi:hypothetical protein
LSGPVLSAMEGSSPYTAGDHTLSQRARGTGDS